MRALQQRQQRWVAKLAQGARSGSGSGSPPWGRQPATWERRSSGLQLLHVQHCASPDLPTPAGNPAVFLRKLKPEESTFLGESAEHYATLAAQHLAETSKPLDQVAREKGLAA